jgi:hypothetical protein
MGLSGMFFQPVHNLRGGFLGGAILQMAQVMLRFFPAMPFAAHQCPKAGVAEQEAGLFCQIQPQTVQRPEGEWPEHHELPCGGAVLRQVAKASENGHSVPVLHAILRQTLIKILCSELVNQNQHLLAAKE